jgi:hypothetical protein
LGHGGVAWTRRVAAAPSAPVLDSARGLACIRFRFVSCHQVRRRIRSARAARVTVRAESRASESGDVPRLRCAPVRVRSSLTYSEGREAARSAEPAGKAHPTSGWVPGSTEAAVVLWPTRGASRYRVPRLQGAGEAPEGRFPRRGFVTGVTTQHTDRVSPVNDGAMNAEYWPRRVERSSLD